MTIFNLWQSFECASLWIPVDDCENNDVVLNKHQCVAKIITKQGMGIGKFTRDKNSINTK